MIWRKKYDISDLTSAISFKDPVRKNFSIAVIDDDLDYPIKDLLQNLDFVITKFDDIKSINEIQGFDIVVCDIRGVGKSFDSKYGGGYVVKEISDKYPQKYIIICSGSMFKIDFAEYFKIADKYIKKDADLSEWSMVLYNAILELSSPINYWERTRLNFKRRNLDSRIINRIEQEYIRSVIKKDTKYLHKIIMKNKSNLSNEYVAFAVNTLLNFTISLISNSLV